jgi:hypothetical protein
LNYFLPFLSLAFPLFGFVEDAAFVFFEVLPPPLLFSVFAFGAEVFALFSDAEDFAAPVDAEDLPPLPAAPEVFDLEAVFEAEEVLAFADDFDFPPSCPTPAALAIASAAPLTAPITAPVAAPVKISPVVSLALSKTADAALLPVDFFAELLLVLLPLDVFLLLEDLLPEEAVFLVVDFSLSFFAVINFLLVGKLL